LQFAVGLSLGEVAGASAKLHSSVVSTVFSKLGITGRTLYVLFLSKLKIALFKKIS
jgi:hypothetical protein